MKITEGTKISDLIKHDPRTIEVIASINHHFEKLRNPLLRKLLASRVTIKDAAKIGGCAVEIVFEKLSGIGFTRGTVSNAEDIEAPSGFSIPEDAKVTELDVRDDIESGKDPFLKILAAIDALNRNDFLAVINSFEPAPLINILRKKNYSCAVVNKDNLVYTYVSKTRDSISFAKPGAQEEDLFDEKLKEFECSLRVIDVSQLEMPQPMITILSEAEVLSSGTGLHVQHRRVPHLLLPELKERGLNILMKEVKEGSVELLIYR